MRLRPVAWSSVRAKSSAALLAGLLVSGAARAQSLVDVMAGRQWAIAAPGNCGLPSKSYWLSSGGGTITWRNGIGHVDVEGVSSSYPGGFTTVTVNSFHAGGRNVPIGTRWAYRMIDPSRISVSSTDGGPFILVPCVR